MGFQPNTFCTIKNTSSNLQLAISGGSTHDDARLIQWPADGTDAQTFLVAAVPGSEPDLAFLPLTTLLALGIADGSVEPGAPVIQWTPASSTNQRFLLTFAEGGFITITSEPTGLVLGIADGSTSRGAAVIQVPSVDSSDQMFALDDAGDGFTSFRNRKSGMLLAISGGSTTPGAPLIQWPADGSDAQKFLVVGDPDAGCVILPKTSVKVLGIAGGSTEPGADVIQWHPDGSANQKFQLAEPDSGFAQIISVPTGLVLGITNGSKAPRAKVVQWPSTNAPDQRFELKEITRAKQPLTATDLAPGSWLLEAMKTHCPELRLHPLERYFPDSIENFMTGSQVCDADHRVVLVGPEATDLVQFGAWGSRPGHDDKEAYYLSPPRNWTDPIIDGPTPDGRVAIDSGEYATGFAGGSVSVPMAVRGFSVNGTYWFDYLYFYPYNGEQVLEVEYYTDPNPLQPLRDTATGWLTLSPMATHIGDWEHAQVQVVGDSTKTEIIAIRVFNHGDPVLIKNAPDDPAWKQLKFDGTHPVLYAGLHSHATYTTPGHHPRDMGDDVNKAIHLSTDIKRLKSSDWCDDGGATWRGWLDLVPFGVDASGRALPGFPGMEWPDFYPHRWGRSRTFSVSTNIRIAHIGRNVPGAPLFTRTELLAGIKAGLFKGASELTDGLGVSPPSWWRSGF